MTTTNLISKTAAGPLFLRTGCGIAFADEIAGIANAEALVSELVGRENLLEMKKTFGAWAELRFKSLSAAVQKCDSILELAAGFSPRGMIFLRRDPSVRYLSTDVWGIHAARRSVFDRIDAIHPSYRIVDATDCSDVERCRHSFYGCYSFAIINEGLLGYFTLQQKLLVARNIRALLARAGGSWWTTDIHTREEIKLHRELGKGFMPRFEKKAGTDFAANAFESLDEAEALMNLAGLNVERREQLEFVPKLESLVPSAAVGMMLEQQHLWRMTPD